MEPSTPVEQILHGIPASPGIAHGQAFVLVQMDLEIPVYQVDAKGRPEEVDRFEQALLATRQQISRVRQQVSNNLGEDEARIFDAHLLVLEDKALIDEAILEMERTGFNIEASFQRVAQRYIDAFDQIDDEYLRERATDLRDVMRRVLQNLLGQSIINLNKLVEQRVLVSRDLAPSESASLDKGNLLGIVTDYGSKTSHVVIVARSMKIPAVVGVRSATESLRNGDWLLVDGYDGLVIRNPSEKTLFRYGKIQIQKKRFEKRLLDSTAQPSRTLDGQHITLMANIETPEDASLARERGAEGVGLYRSEFLFLNSSVRPSEEAQYEVYRRAAEAMAPWPLVFRTLDIGGDKPLDALLARQDPEPNPFMGFRGIRFCLENPKLFKTQLRAVLRASVVGNIQIMYPMISGLEELLKANALLEEAKEELRSQGQPFQENIRVGAMVEIPSAALICDLLAKHCHFFSVGTNDLIQYLLAIDRVNSRISHLYEPTHPAVLRVLRSIFTAGEKAGIPVGVCGEMAGDPCFVPLLLGLGATSLSISPSLLPAVRYLVQRMQFSEARELAHAALRSDDPKAIYQSAIAFYKDHMREDS